jgi:uncharacterized membrane protein YcaP (DUF421 family)
MLDYLRSFRIFQIAIFDVVATIIGAYLLDKYLNINDLIFTIVFTFLLGIIVHRLLNIRTTVDKFLFPNL